MNKKERCTVFGIGLVLLAIFTFTDLQISQVICTKNIFGRIFEVIGELPFIFLATTAMVLLFRFRSKKYLACNFLLGIFYGFLILLLASMGGFMLVNYLQDNLQVKLPLIVPILIGILILFGAILLARKVKEENKREALHYAIIAVCYFFAVLIVMNVLKAVWGRMRFREMTDPITQFTKWYVINDRGGFNNIYASFPSGHTMNSAGVILLTLLPTFLPRLKSKEKLFKGITYSWIILVGLSRVVMGAHFASDVTVGALLSLALFDIIRTIIKKLNKVK